MSFLGDEEEKFTAEISGMSDNLEIEIEGDNDGDQPGIMSSAKDDNINHVTETFGITPDELNTAMNAFTQIMITGTDPDFMEKLEPHMHDIGDENGDGYQLDIMGLKMILDKFLGGNHVPKQQSSNPFSGSLNESNPSGLLAQFMSAFGASQQEIQDLLKRAEKAEKKAKNPFDENPDIDAPEEEIFDVPLDSYEYEIVTQEDSFGFVKHIPRSDLYEHFKDVYGEGPYGISLFTSLEGYNLIAALKNVDTFEYIEDNDSYILFRAISSNSEIEDFVMAIIQTNEDEFEMMVPMYGNTYNVETGDSIVKGIDEDFYVEEEDKNGGVEVLLKNPLDLDRSKTSIELALYEEKNPLLSPHDFGKIFVAPAPATFTSDFVKVGRIKSNESKESMMFKDHCDLDERQEMFDFYIKLPQEYSARMLQSLQEYFQFIDFNTNPKIKSCELYNKNYDALYIELDLGKLPEMARWWRER